MKRIFSFCTLFVLLLTTFALARDVRMTASSVVPAAEGKVNIDKDQNGNFKIKVEVHHLAKPANLTPAETNYVVWIQARGAAAENQGLLKVNNDLNGDFETTTRHEAFDVFVTAESDANASLPTGAEVLRATVQP